MNLYHYIIAITLIIASLTAPGYAIQVINADRLANAIYRAENSKKYPYGIKSINTHGNKAYARKICLNTIRNNAKRYNKIKNPKIDYITFLGSRFCPIGADDDPTGLNRNWIKNVKYFYNIGE